MGRQSSGSRKVVIRLEYSPQRVIPTPARFVDVQLAELLEHLPPGHLSPAIRLAVVRHGLGVPNTHVLAHRLEPRPHKLTAPIAEAGSDPRGHLWVTWGVYLCAGKPPLADSILSHPTDLTRSDSVIGLAVPAMSGHIQYGGAASGDLYIRISGINRVFLS